MYQSHPPAGCDALPAFGGAGGRQRIHTRGRARAFWLSIETISIFRFMAKIDKIIIDDILRRAKIEEVARELLGTYSHDNRGGLKKKGVRYLAICPFHDDRSLGSFVIYPKGNCYKCFSCDAKGGVVDFVMQHEHLTYPDAIRWLGRFYNIDTDMTDFNYTPPPPRPVPPPLPMLTLPMDMVKSRESYEANNLVAWMLQIRWDSIQRRRLPEVLSDYHIGTTRKGWTIWWQIDEQQRVRTGKMMEYKDDGHRVKDEGYHSDWIHSALFRDKRHPEYDEDKQEMHQCLFGLHLLDRYKRKGIDQQVCLVESEKTAILMATAYGNNAKQVWMACGGLENLTNDRLRPLLEQERKIVIYPDRDGIDKWKAKAQAIGSHRIIIDTTPVTKWWEPADGDKADIADVVVRMIQQGNPYTSIGEIKKYAPHLAPLIEKLNLKITEQ